jgi:hypothetical protein
MTARTLWIALLAVVLCLAGSGEGRTAQAAGAAPSGPPPARESRQSLSVVVQDKDWRPLAQAPASLNTDGCKDNTLQTLSPLVIDNTDIHADAIFNRCQHRTQNGYWYIFAQSTGYAKAKWFPGALTGLEPAADGFASAARIADRSPAGSYNADQDPINVNFGVSYGGVSAGVRFPLYKDLVTPTTVLASPVAYKTRWSGAKGATAWSNSVTVVNEWVLLVNYVSTPNFTARLTIYWLGY